MKLWADIYNATWQKQGDGSVPVVTANVKRVLDSVGLISFTVSQTSQRVQDLITPQARFVLYWEDDLGAKRELTRGIIDRLDDGDGSGQRVIQAQCSDIMDELRRENALYNRQFDDTAAATVVAELIGLVTGWSYSAESGLPNITFRADYASVLKAIQRSAEAIGAHFRLAESGSTLEFGYFGQDNGLYIIGRANPSIDLQAGTVLLVDSLRRTRDDSGIFNWIVPLGGGEGEAALTLHSSNRSVAGGYAYDISTSTNPDGSTLYYLEDTTSTAAVGAIKRALKFNDISPIANNNAARQVAANALYDAAVVWLQRHKDEYVTYQFTLKNVRNTIRVGDLINVRYKGDVIDAGGSLLEYVSVVGQFWVTNVVEAVSEDGLIVTIEIANLDRLPKTTEAIVIDSVEAIASDRISTKPFPVMWTDGGIDSIAARPPSSTTPDKYATFYFAIEEYITGIISAQLRVLSLPMETTTTIAGATTNYYFGVLVDTPAQYVSDVSLYINSTDRSSDLGGPWNTGGGNTQIDLTLDITDILIEDGINQEHTIEFRATAPSSPRPDNVPTYTASTAQTTHGRIQARLTVLGYAQAIK